MLGGKTITRTSSHGGRPEIIAQDMRICFGDGVNVRYFEPGAKLPAKHQLFLGLSDSSAICCTVQMYGGLWAFPEGMNDDPITWWAWASRRLWTRNSTGRTSMPS